MKNDSRRALRKNPRPNTSDPLSCLFMTRDAIQSEIAHLEAQIEDSRRRVSWLNGEIEQVNTAIMRFPN